MRDRRALLGNELLPLDALEGPWIVECGSLGLFGVRWGARGPEGARRFYFERAPGDVLFPLGPIAPGRIGVVAVALEDSRLRPADGAGLAREDWERRWETMTGASARPGATVAAWDAMLLECLAARRTAEEHDEQQRFQTSGRRTEESTREAVAELSSVLSPADGGLPAGSDLFLAAWMVGRATGIVLRPPGAESDGGQDPVARIAEASQVRCRRVLLHGGWHTKDCGPLLGLTAEERRPLALLPLAGERYEVFDPVTRSRSPLTPERAAALDPHAWTFYPPLPANGVGGLQLARFALRGRSRDLVALLGAAAGATLLAMFTPQATALLVDHAIPDADRSLLGLLVLGLLAAALGGAVFRFAQGVAMMRVETGADVTTQAAVWDRLLKLQLSFFRRFSTGDLLSRVTAISQIRAYLSGTTLRTLFSSVVALLNLGLLLHYSRPLTLIALSVAGLTVVVTLSSGFAILRNYRRILELQGRFFGLLVQLVNGVAKLRVAAAEERAFGQWARAYARLARLELRQRTLQDGVRTINLALSTVSAIALFAVAASLVRGGLEGPALTTGLFLAFHVAYGTFIGAVANLSNTVTDVMAIAILQERARPILAEPPEVHQRRADPGRLAGRVRIDHVVFRYREDGPAILDGVSVEAAAGEFVALVGPSGSGKSTLFRLLLGFENPHSGTVQYDGQDLAGLDVTAVRRQLGVVLQTGRINAGSLFENVVCGTQMTLNDAWDAARATGFADEIAAMPMGMHTMISEGGTNLSGGQRQRLLLTRALVHRPRLVLLDEATSALDNRTQAVVSQSLEQLDVTRIVIAHRLSTVRQADRIYVVDAGRVVQEGTFESLAAQPGLFARLMERQRL
jgi:ATP-binding cassette subfamily C protein